MYKIMFEVIFNEYLRHFKEWTALGERQLQTEFVRYKSNQSREWRERVNKRTAQALPVEHVHSMISGVHIIFI